MYMDLYNTVFIQVDLTLRCQLNCAYCCEGSNTYKYKQQDDELFFQNYLNLLKYEIPRIKTSLPIRLRLMGGEPTLQPHLTEILAETIKNQNISGFSLFTNSLRPNPIIKSSSQENFIVTTLHLNAERTFKKILQNTLNNDNNIIFNVMVDDYDEYPDFSTLLKTLKEIHVHQKFIHIQPLKNGKGYNYQNYLKWHKLFYEEHGFHDYYDNRLKKMSLFFNQRLHKCNVRTSTYKNGMFESDCDDSILNLDSLILQKKFCRNPTCFCDTVYFN